MDGSKYTCTALYTDLTAGLTLTSTTNIKVASIEINPAKYAIVPTGESAMFTCVVIAKEGVNLKWRKHADDYTENDKNYVDLTTSARQDNYNTDNKSRKSTLTLSSLTNADSTDTIECYEENNPALTATMELNVVGKIIKPIGWAKKFADLVSKGVVAGEEVIFTCTVSTFTNTALVIEWFQKFSSGEGAQTGNEYTYTIDAVDQWIDNGVYYCLATYTQPLNLGDAVFKSEEVNLFVRQINPTPTTPVFIHTGETISLDCSLSIIAESAGTSDIKWYKDGVEVVQQVGVLEVKNGIYDGTNELQKSTYTDTDVDKNDGGVYKCEFTFAVGEKISFETTVNVYHVESVNKEVKKGSDTTISCVITGLTETATVTWRTSTGPVPAEKFTAVQGSHSGGTQTSTLAVDGTLVNDDTAYTCRVTSGSLPDSSHSDTTVNLNVYDVESVDKEVKKGSDTTISCVITGLTESATVTWQTSTGAVPAEKFTPVQGSHSGGKQTSTLEVDGSLVNEHTAYTCRVTSGSLPNSSHSDTTVNLNVYDVESVDKEVKKGSDTTISCVITGLTETATVTWQTSTGEVSGDKLVPVQGSQSGGTQISTLEVDGSLVNEDTAYTCRVTSGSLPDSSHSDTTVNLNVYDVESVDKEVKRGSDTTISCVITGLTETATVTWQTSTGAVSGEKFTPVQGSHSGGKQTSTLEVDGSLVNEDTAYTCRVTSGSLPDSSHSETTVNLNVYGTFFNANSYLAT
ncbi:uncharacterized protein LOC134825422 [Bolinopsis microptera]|uniref:uncharacterized protein LOC134825422 n=1 Tax=Bolinopsis microptera TaxID=2820187 RepID=UPI003079AD7B